MLTPELIALLLNNGLGGFAVVLLFRVNQQLAQMLKTDNEHDRRIVKLEDTTVKLADTTKSLARIAHSHTKIPVPQN